MHSRFSNWTSLLLICLAGVGVGSISGRALAASDAAEGWKVGWKNGFYLKGPGDDFELKIGGRLYGDFAAITSDPSSYGTRTGVEIRSARLFASGSLYQRAGFKVEYDFAREALKDAYLSIGKVPWLGRLQIGHFKEPFSLEESTSSRFIPFMERSLANALSPRRNTGLMASSTAFDKRMTWAIGGFRKSNDENGVGFGGAGGYAITGRATAAPVYADGGSKVVHSGLSYSHQFRKDTTTCAVAETACIDWSAKPEAHLGPILADTGAIRSDGAHLLDLEAAVVFGAWSVQAEYISAWVSRIAGSADDVRFWGVYAQASYFLTGEHRNYVLEKGAFGRIDVLKPLGQGWGALELVFRYSRLDMNDAAVRYGNVQDFSVGVNWYLFSNLRMMANYVHSEDMNAASKYNIFQARAQIDF